MDNLIIFRLFLSFPLIGLLIPDLGSLLANTKNYIPAEHLITEITLLISVMVCSAGIAYFKRKLNGIAIIGDNAVMV